jgi:hypothetical protein
MYVLLCSTKRKGMHMNKIQVEYVTGSEEKSPVGLYDVICPACGKQTRETDTCRIGEENGEREIEICGDCLSDAETALDVRIEADLVPNVVFQKLWEHVLPIAEDLTSSEPPNDVTQLARLLGGQPWHSGGGVWLVLVKRDDGRVVAVSDEVVTEYANEDALTGAAPIHTIRLV